MVPETFRYALPFASASMLKEANILRPLVGGVFGGAKAVGSAVGKATGVTPLAKGMLGKNLASQANLGDDAFKAMRATGTRRLAGTAILGTATAATGSALKNQKTTQNTIQQRYGSADSRFRRPNPATGHSQTGLY